LADPVYVDVIEAAVSATLFRVAGERELLTERALRAAALSLWMSIDVSIVAMTTSVRR
jgi:hypothetical protein